MMKNMRMRMRMMKNMMMIKNMIRDIPTLNSSNNVLRGHSRIRASTCIPRRWMAGSPCRWPVEVEIKMNPYIPQKSISCDSWMVFFPRLLRHTLNLWNPSNPFSIARRSRWKPCHGGKSTTRRHTAQVPSTFWVPPWLAGKPH